MSNSQNTEETTETHPGRPMKILGHIHTFNDEEVIDRSLQALLNQTYPVEEIVLVDNASTDGTLRRTFPDKVTVVQNPQNLGTSGAVIQGMKYALEKHYDWIYLLDADSLPHEDALQQLVDLYHNFPTDQQTQIWLLSSLPCQAPGQEPRHGIVFSPRGCEMSKPSAKQPFYECDATIWSGSLYKLSAVHTVGLPNADYVLDWGEYEYGYLGKQYGYRSFMHQNSVLEHSVGDVESPVSTYHFGSYSLRIKKLQLPPIRLYYIFRNSIYFWFYVYYKSNIFRYLRQSSQSPNLVCLAKYFVRVLLLSTNRRPELWACLRGTWDGLCKNMHHRY